MLFRNIKEYAMALGLGERIIEAQIITGTHIGEKVCIPRIIMSPIEPRWTFMMKSNINQSENLEQRHLRRGLSSFASHPPPPLLS
jgi:hypothetical protein